MNDIVLNWGIVAVVLLILEVLTGTFYLLSLAAGAAIVAIVMFIHPFSIEGQVLLFIVTSVISIQIVRRIPKDKTIPRVGQSNDGTIGSIGEITEKLENKRFNVSFDTQVMGNRNWISISSDELSIGDKVKVLKVEGNYLVVSKELN